MRHSYVYSGQQADINKNYGEIGYLKFVQVFLKKCITTMVENHIKYSPLLITSNQILVCWKFWNNIIIKLKSLRLIPVNYLEFQGKYTLLRNSLVCFETLNQKPNLFYIVHNHVGNIF